MTTLYSNERDTSIQVHVPPRDVDEIGASNDITESQSLSPSLSTCVSLPPPPKKSPTRSFQTETMPSAGVLTC